MLIRTLHTTDVPPAVAIIHSHHAFDGKCAKHYYETYFASPARIESEREQNFAAIDEESGNPVGVCGFAPDKYDSPEILWLTWFYVDAGYRGKGVGKALMTHTLAEAARLSTRKVYLDTSSHPGYAKSIQVYKSFGFNIEGSLTNYHGGGEDVVIMGLNLRKESPRDS